MHRVLIADDDRAIRESLARAPELEGYGVDVVGDGVEALTSVRHDRFDALVVMLTARVETPDRVAGLDAGADDYLPKPFDLDERLARLRALLRRAWWGPDELALSKTEFDLLELLTRNEGSCSTPPRSTSASGGTTSAPTRRTSPSTSATCAASSPRRARPR